jgi:hypothetical protein
MEGFRNDVAPSRITAWATGATATACTGATLIILTTLTAATAAGETTYGS